MAATRQKIPPRTAMVLAAGFGERMRPLTEKMPKPLVPVAGKPLLDHVLDRLAAAGVARAVINVHYLADQIEKHVASRKAPQIVISDERTKLLNTGGGVVKALPTIGTEPFFHINSDTIWIDGVRPNLERLVDEFDPDSMDALLLLAPTAHSRSSRLVASARYGGLSWVSTASASGASWSSATSSSTTTVRSSSVTKWTESPGRSASAVRTASH